MSDYMEAMNTYWRVCAEYLTVELVNNVRDDAPIGQWIPALYSGEPYAYFQSKEFAKETLKDVIKHRMASLEYKLTELEKM